MDVDQQDANEVFAMAMKPSLECHWTRQLVASATFLQCEDPMKQADIFFEMEAKVDIKGVEGNPFLSVYYPQT